MLVSELIVRAGGLLQDLTGVRWPENELVRWLNDGQRAIVNHRHDASVTNTALLLAANTTKQALPAGSVALMSIGRNLGADGLTPGSSINLTERDYLMALVPTWHSETGVASIKNYVYDVRSPKEFYVYPRTHATTPVYVEALICVLPLDCIAPSVNPAATITLADEYMNPLVDYIMYRAFSKDTEAWNLNRAQSFHALFNEFLGIKTKSDVVTNPNTKTGSPA